MKEDGLVEPEFSQGYAGSFGWMRRPELDTQTVEAWELPDGRLYANCKQTGRLILTRAKLK